MRPSLRVFRFLLELENGEPPDPAVFVTVVPNWTIGERLLLSSGVQYRIAAIETDVASKLVEQGVNAVWTVELA